MAVGKSTVGPLVAQHLGLGFLDLDAVVVQQAGQDVASLFQREGEPGFRAREQRALRSVLSRGPSVLALGGGTLHHPGNLGLVREWGDVVALLAPLSLVAARIGPERPLAGQLERLYRERQPLYETVDNRVRVVGRSPEQVAQAVIEVLS